MDPKDLAFAAAKGGTPPSGLSDELKALWFARSGRWEAAHDLCKDLETGSAFWVHAHLHRVKGELENAGYWYDRAQVTQPEGQSRLGEEWLEIAGELLSVE